MNIVLLFATHNFGILGRYYLMLLGAANTYFFSCICESVERELTFTRQGNSAVPSRVLIVLLAKVLFDPSLIVFSS